ncbi:sterol desaturase family protein [Gallaecimonas sp. GXIMD4217]|uniref:sterol desaturase family protein n=1 Tax=Gallaecimonas sp. GXIMD4217 TaxID=3131927 RepID=UPI00311B30E9
MEIWLLLALGPLFGAFIAWEWYRHPDRYCGREVLCNAFLAISHQLVDILAWTGIILLYQAVYEHRLLTIEVNVLSALGLFIAQDFLYYWFHRSAHRVRWLWAAHVVHHSSERLNFSTALRQSLFYPLAAMWAFWLPLAWLGFEPGHIMLIVAINLAYQFFIHTQAVSRLGPLEWILNTPSHHRAHHGKNPEYIDRNFGGVLIIWDRLFGTFVEEKAAPDYGIPERKVGLNPWEVLTHEWRFMLGQALKKNQSLKHRLWFLFGPPEWRPVTGECPRRTETAQPGGMPDPDRS